MLSLVVALLKEETVDQDAAYAAAQVDPHAVPHASGEPTVAASAAHQRRSTSATSTGSGAAAAAYGVKASSWEDGAPRPGSRSPPA